MNPKTEQVVIVGAGPIGIACGVAATRAGFDPLLIDAGQIVNSILHYPIGMRFFTTPELLEIGGHPFPCSGAKPTREEALKYYRGVARTEGLRVQPLTRLLGGERRTDTFQLDIETATGRQQLASERLVLATGYFDHPNRLGVPGDDLPHVYSTFDEGHHSVGLDVVVIGGKNSAVEAALDLFRCGARVTLIYRRSEFRPSVKYWMKPDIENRMAAGEIRGLFDTEVVSIRSDSVRVRSRSGEEEDVPAQRIYALIGFHPDEALFRRLGIAISEKTGIPQHDPETHETNVPGLYLAGSVTAGRKISEIFIENGRFDGEKIFRT